MVDSKNILIFEFNLNSNQINIIMSSIKYANEQIAKKGINQAIIAVSKEIENLSEDGTAHTNINQIHFFVNVIKNLKLKQRILN